MKSIPPQIIYFLQKQHFVIVSTIDRNGFPHNSCKGIIDIEPNGRIYLLDLYHGNTYRNIKHNNNISISVVDEHHFIGYCIKGKATIESIRPDDFKRWADKIVSRISHRIVKKIHGERGHPSHPEIHLPTPKYMISMEVEEIVNLSPRIR